MYVIIFGLLMIAPGLMAFKSPCTSDTDVKLYVAPGNCAGFMQCEYGGIPRERPCGPGTNFNVDIQGCTWPENVDCSAAEEEPVTTTSAPTTTEALEPVCPPDIEFGTIAMCNDPTGTWYVDCFSGFPLVSRCSQGLVYNELTSTCSLPEQVFKCLPPV